MTQTACIWWTADEDAVLRRDYGRRTCADIGRQLGRSAEAVKQHAGKLKLKHARRWTPELDAVVRAGWGKVRLRELAAQVGRTSPATKMRAFVLGLDAERFYSDDEVALVRELYPTHTAAQIAERMFGTARGAMRIYKLAERLGLSKLDRLTPEFFDRVRELHGRGLTDPAIASEMLVTREQVTHARRRLGLSRNVKAAVEAWRRGVEKQKRTLGIRNGGDLRALGYRRFARANGWPEDLRPREVQILNVLAERGPMTAEEIATAIGMPTGPLSSGRRRILLADSGRDGTYTASLKNRGLILYVMRFGSGKPRGNRLPGLYMLTAEATAILEANATTAKEVPHGA